MTHDNAILNIKKLPDLTSGNTLNQKKLRLIITIKLFTVLCPKLNCIIINDVICSLLGSGESQSDLQSSKQTGADSALTSAIKEKLMGDSGTFSVTEIDNHNTEGKKRHHWQRPAAVANSAWHNIRSSLKRSSLSRNDLIYIIDFLIITQQSGSNRQGKRFRPLPQGI